MQDSKSLFVHNLFKQSEDFALIGIFFGCGQVQPLAAGKKIDIT